MSKVNTQFNVAIYGTLEQYNATLSKARCRIFYKYENRNGTYITDEFAEKLIASLPYTPVKGIYEEGDYTDHGAARTDGRIYGIVPEQPNVLWEKHVDEDGVEREYACADVLLFTAIYPETNKIVGKAQSMELYEKTLKWHMAIIKGQKYAVFDDGGFLGLQVLGDDIEPCFEGAAFYTLVSQLEQALSQLQNSTTGGQFQMNKLNFKLSDNQKFDAIWTLLNSEYNEEGNWTISYSICDIFDEYALTYNYENSSYERIYYTKNDKTDTIELGEHIRVYIIDVTESEKQTLDTLRVLNGDTYELVNENLTNAKENAEKVTELNGKISEYETQVSTLNTEIDTVKEQFTTAETARVAAEQEVETLKTTVTELNTYKHNIETQQKQAVIAEYTDKLSATILDGYSEKLDEYTVLDLDKELAYQLKCNNSAIFTQSGSGILPKDNPETGIAQILSRYEKK